MEVVWWEVSEEVERGERGERTDDVMSRPVELFLEVDDGEGHAEKVDRVASPGQPSSEERDRGLRSKFNRPRRCQAFLPTQRKRDPTG